MNVELIIGNRRFTFTGPWWYPYLVLWRREGMRADRGGTEVKWREHTWSRKKYFDAVTPAGCRCIRCGVSYDDLMMRGVGEWWRCRFIP